MLWNCQTLYKHNLGNLKGDMADEGGFTFKPAELTPEICDDLTNKLIGRVKYFVNFFIDT